MERIAGSDTFDPIPVQVVDRGLCYNNGIMTRGEATGLRLRYAGGSERGYKR